MLPAILAGHHLDHVGQAAALAGGDQAQALFDGGIEAQHEGGGFGGGHTVSRIRGFGVISDVLLL